VADKSTQGIIASIAQHLDTQMKNTMQFMACLLVTNTIKVQAATHQEILVPQQLSLKLQHIVLRPVLGLLGR